MSSSEKKEDIIIIEEIKENDHTTICEGVDSTKNTNELSSSIIQPIEENKMNNKKKWWEFWKQDPEQLAMNPQDFSRAKKNLILLTIALATLVAPISTTIYIPALVTIQKAFNTDDTSMNATLSAFTFTIAVFPLFWSTIGEVYGRRRVYLVSFLIYIIGAVACALAVNIQMFIAFRVVTAIGSSSVLSMGAGTIQDCFRSHERGRAFALYASGPLLGPALGPIIGGYLNIGLGWRSNLAFVAIYGSVIWFCILFFLPETSRPMPALPGQEPTKPKLRNPLSALIFFKYFNVILIVIYSGIAFMMFFLVNTTFTRILTIQYKMDTGTIGLCYLPLAGGAMIGNQIGGRFSDYNFVKNSTAAKKNGQEVYPEMRISVTIIALAAILACCGFISYGWCMEKNVHYAYSLVCIFFLAIGLMIPTLTIATYLIDAFKSKASAVTACVSLARFAMAGVGSIIASPLVNALGNGVLFSICGSLLFCLAFLIFYVKYNPKKWAAQLAKNGL
ncbi:unnamed protein product [Cunninghamella echinulata]